MKLSAIVARVVSIMVRTNGSGMERLRVVGTVGALCFALAAGVSAEPIAEVQYFNVAGTLEGSIRQHTASYVTLSSSSVITGDLLTPGTPTVSVGGSATYAGTIDGSGNSSPSNYTVTISNGATLRHVIRRSDPPEFAPVAPPSSPSGTRSVTIASASESAGDWTTLRNLTLANGVGGYAVPPGVYGNFSAGSGSRFVLGAVGATQPSIYHFQAITLSGLEVVGPVEITIPNGQNLISLPTGSSDHPEWLILKAPSAYLNISGGTFHGVVEFANGGLTVYPGAVFIGGVSVKGNLYVANGGLLRLVSPNVPAFVELSAPTNGATFAQSSAISLSATATDSDGTVTKVEFYDGTTKLGEDTSSPFAFDWSGAALGSHTLKARVFDNSGAQTDSTSVTITVRPTLPYTADFESTEGYAAGALAGQKGWSATGNADVQTVDAANGSAAVALSAGASVSEARQDFAALAGQTVVYADLFLKPVAGATAGAGSSVSTNAARVAATLELTHGTLQLWFGDGAGGGAWQSTGVSFPIDSGNRATTWQRITLRHDFTTKQWDLYFNGLMAAAAVRFADDAATVFQRFVVAGPAAGEARFDDLYVGTDNPLFTDADNDGLEDAYESTHGLNPSVNDRDGDADGDGLSNLREYVLGTNPSAADTDGDGLPDRWETEHATNPLVRDDALAASDSDGDDLTLAQELALGTNPENADSDGDGMPDGWEVLHGLAPLTNDAGGNADGDTLTNGREYRLGTNPNIGIAPNSAELVGLRLATPLE